MSLLGGIQNNGKSGTRYGYGCKYERGSQIIFKRNQSSFPSTQSQELCVAGDEQISESCPSSKITINGDEI